MAGFTPDLDDLQRRSVATETRAVADWGPLGATPGGYTGKSGRAGKPYFTGLSRSCFKVAEREGLSSTDLPDARNPINKRLSATGESRCVPTDVYHYKRSSPSQLA
jgi:hypothetical protein